LGKDNDAERAKYTEERIRTELRAELSISGAIVDAASAAPAPITPAEETRDFRFSTTAFPPAAAQEDVVATSLPYSAAANNEPGAWHPPPAKEQVLPREVRSWDLSSHTGESGLLARRACVQKHLFGTLGLDAPTAYFVQGCDYSPLHDFDRWAAGTGCGSEPVPGILRYHVAWTGPYEHVREDLDALIQSFLTTQDTKRSRLTFWLIEMEPDPTDPFQQQYQGHPAVEFVRGDMSILAQGTAMEGKPEFLDLDWSTVKKGPRWRANLFRILILHKHGGVWVDTDSLLLRDLRPLVEFAGEFASKLTMSHYYNNNAMAFRAGSSLGAKMIEDVVATPFQDGERKYCKYVGSPCYPKWTWNHGLIQLAVREQRGIVIFPTQFTDPAYACFPPWLLAKSGGMPMRDFNIGEISQLIRGAFILHTRAYNADKPIHPKSNYGRLYALAAAGAAAGHDESADLVPLPPRNRTELEDILHRRGDNVNVVDPAFIPRGAKQFVLLKSAATGQCVDAVRGVKGETFGGFPTLQAGGNCAKAQTKFNETVVFLWYSEWGYLRPAHREPGRVLCVDALSYNIYPPKDVTWKVTPQMITCKSNRPSQQWTFDVKHGVMKNPHTQFCMDPGKDHGQLVLRPCERDSSSQKLIMLPFSGELPKDFDEARGGGIF
jgi:hypothetical protein